MRKFYYTIFLTSLFFPFFIFQSIAQEAPQLDTLKLQNMSLDDLLKLKSTGISSEMEKIINAQLGVASKKPLSIKKSPSIISVITEEEIRKSGARELLDVLRQIPGFDFGVDVVGVISVGIRGNWAHEGKVLMMLDGQEINETLYGTIQLGNNYPISQIKRIEVIRGPGSAIYGGYAEYGVINIITKTGEELDGGKIDAVYGQMQKTYARRNISVALGKKIKDWNISFSGLIGQGNRSDRKYTDTQGFSYDMAGNSNLNPSYSNLSVSYKNTSLRLMYDYLGTTSQDGNGYVMSKAYANNFTSYYLELKHNWKINKKLTVSPKFNFKRQVPWNFSSTSEEADMYPVYNKTSDRYRFNVTALYDISTKLNVIAGGELYQDRATAKGDPADWFKEFVNDSVNNYKDKVHYNNRTVFAQALWKNRLFNLTLGARYDNNSAFGDAFVPRIGLVKSIRKFNFKLLFGYSFRAPAIENISSAYLGQIKPEKTQTLEFEIGWQVNRNSYFTANIFDFTTKTPIVYAANPDKADDEVYLNKDKSGSQGLELEYKVKEKWGYININYSYYTVGNKPVLDSYQIPNVRNQLLAFAKNKVNMNASFQVSSQFSINPSLSYLSKRYGYTSEDGDGNLILQEYKPVLLANIFLTYDHLFTNGLNIGGGCYDIFGQNFQFIQPYNSGHAPLPGSSREFVLRLTYLFSFKK